MTVLRVISRASTVKTSLSKPLTTLLALVISIDLLPISADAILRVTLVVILQLVVAE
jgi:hypothetical protein